MSKRHILAVVCFLFVLQLMAVSHYGFINGGLEVSACNLAMGGIPVAAANYWHANPLAAYSNPAFTALNPGFSYSGSSFDFLELKHSSGNEILEHRSSLIGFSYKGIGLLTSLEPLTGGAFATDTAFGEFIIYDESGNDTGVRYYPRETSNIYGISIDVREFASIFNSTAELLPFKMDLALGINHVRSISTLSSDGGKAKGSSNSLGVLAQVPVYQVKSMDWESGAGVSLYNAFNQSKPLTASDGKERIYKRLNASLSLAGRLKSSDIMSEAWQEMFPNIATFRLIAGANEEFASDPLILGMGTEYGVMDLLFLRAGYHYDKAGQIEGLTYGIGLNLHFGDLIGIHYDYSVFPGGRISADKSMQEVGAYINVPRLLSRLSNGR